jgi:hypothetical protein
MPGSPPRLLDLAAAIWHNWRVAHRSSVPSPRLTTEDQWDFSLLAGRACGVGGPANAVRERVPH